MFTAHQIQILKGVIEDAKLTNLKGESLTITDSDLADVLWDIEIALLGIAYRKDKDNV